VSPLAARA